MGMVSKLRWGNPVLEAWWRKGNSIDVSYINQSITSQPDPFEPHKRTQKENRNLYIQYLPTSNRGRGPPPPNVVAVQKQKSPAPPPCVPQRKVSCPGISWPRSKNINYKPVPLYQHMITISRHLIRLRITVVTIFSRHLHGPGLLCPKSLGDWNMQTSTKLLGSSRHKKGNEHLQGSLLSPGIRS